MVFNGNPHYHMLGQIKDHELVVQLIRECPADQKEFNILDIGAGQFQWGDALADYINTEIDPPKLMVNIFSVRGEPLDLEEVSKPETPNFYINDPNSVCILKKACLIHHLGAVKIEEIGSELSDRWIKPNMHFVITHMCMPHLVDPLGTFAQILTLLEPGKGYAWMDSGYFVLEMDGKKFEADQEHLLQLMTETHTAFLRTRSLSRNAGSFLLKRKGETPPELQLQYTGVQADRKIRGASSQLTCFRRDIPLPPLSFSSPEKVETTLTEEPQFKLLEDPAAFIGDRALFEWLQKNDLFTERATSYFVELKDA
jgi:hypothetical protein